MTRLFVALPIPEVIADAVEPLQNGVPQARWLARESLHITLSFCGEVDGATMHELIEALADIDGGTFEVELSGVELFADGKRPRALVASVPCSDQLGRLQKRIANAARLAGIDLERRRFRPHLTLARFAARAETGHHLAQFLAGNSLFRAGPWLAESYVLYSSRQGAEGRLYTAEAEYSLHDAA